MILPSKITPLKKTKKQPNKPTKPQPTLCTVLILYLISKVKVWVFYPKMEILLCCILYFKIYKKVKWWVLPLVTPSHLLYRFSLKHPTLREKMCFCRYSLDNRHQDPWKKLRSFSAALASCSKRSNNSAEGLSPFNNKVLFSCYLFCVIVMIST